MPPAFILSQDQTLHCKKLDRPFRGAFSWFLFFSKKRGSCSASRGTRLTHHFRIVLCCSISKELPSSRTPQARLSRNDRRITYTAFTALQADPSLFRAFPRRHTQGAPRTAFRNNERIIYTPSKPPQADPTFFSVFRCFGVFLPPPSRGRTARQRIRQP